MINSTVSERIFEQSQLLSFGYLLYSKCFVCSLFVSHGKNRIYPKVIPNLLCHKALLDGFHFLTISWEIVLRGKLFHKLMAPMFRCSEINFCNFQHISSCFTHRKSGRMYMWYVLSAWNWKDMLKAWRISLFSKAENWYFLLWSIPHILHTIYKNQNEWDEKCIVLADSGSVVWTAHLKSNFLIYDHPKCTSSKQSSIVRLLNAK